MRFTEKEIELAYQLGDTGLEWRPEPGDWFYIKELEECFTVTDSSETDILSWYNQAMHEFDKRCCTWLPLWHQCRKILKEANIELTISDMPFGTNITVTLWKRNLKGGGLEFYQQIIADTDLEAMYQVFLRFGLSLSKPSI